MIGNVATRWPAARILVAVVVAGLTHGASPVAAEEAKEAASSTAETGAVAQPAPTAVPAAAARTWPGRVTATYKIAFNGFDIGQFKFTSNVTGQSYALGGQAELSALLGAFQWSSQTRSAGLVAGDQPRPQGYTFDFRTGNRYGAIKMGFTDGAITTLAAVPPGPPLPGSVPVRDVHMRDVLDPLSAVMALSRNVARPCARKLAIFDGKQRFDLVLTSKRQVRIPEAKPSGMPNIGHVCRVRYVPIAGHRMNDETRQMAENAGIEIIMRPIPLAGVAIPYEITIPTVAGTAVLTSTRVEIVAPNRREIALVH